MPPWFFTTLIKLPVMPSVEENPLGHLDLHNTYSFPVKCLVLQYKQYFI